MQAGEAHDLAQRTVKAAELEEATLLEDLKQIDQSMAMPDVDMAKE